MTEYSKIARSVWKLPCSFIIFGGSHAVFIYTKLANGFSNDSAGTYYMWVSALKMSTELICYSGKKMRKSLNYVIHLVSRFCSKNSLRVSQHPTGANSILNFHAACLYCLLSSGQTFQLRIPLSLQISFGALCP